MPFKCIPPSPLRDLVSCLTHIFLLPARWGPTQGGYHNLPHHPPPTWPYMEPSTFGGGEGRIGLSNGEVWEGEFGGWGVNWELKVGGIGLHKKRSKDLDPGDNENNRRTSFHHPEEGYTNARQLHALGTAASGCLFGPQALSWTALAPLAVRPLRPQRRAPLSYAEDKLRTPPPSSKSPSHPSLRIPLRSKTPPFATPSCAASDLGACVCMCMNERDSISATALLLLFAFHPPPTQTHRTDHPKGPSLQYC